MPVRIRRAGTSDFFRLAALERSCFGEDAIKPDLDSAAWWVGVDEHGGAQCYAGARVWRAEYDGEQAAYLHRAGVSPDARGMGLQRRLVLARLRWARDQGLPEAWTYTSHDNFASINTLIRCGFRVWSPNHWWGVTNPTQVSEGVGWVFWRRPL